MKRFATLICALALFACASAQAVQEVRFGYFSYGEVLRSAPGYAAAQQRVEQLRATYQKELDRNKEDFSKQFGEYIEGQQTFPENILRKRQKELETLMEGSLKFKEEARQILREEEEKTMQPLRQQVADAIHALGMERGYAFILDTDKGAFPFVNGAVGTDVTADILQKLK